MDSCRPKVGLGVLLFNSSRQMLMGKRKNSHGEHTWANPGGHLEFGESFEECAVREVLEETGLHISNPQFVGVTNNVFDNGAKHYVSVFMAAKYTEGQVIQNLEPNKTEEWCWVALDKLPSPLFLSLEEILSRDAAKHTLHQIVNTFFPEESVV